MGTVYKRGKTWTAQVRAWVDSDGNYLPKPINRTKGGFPTAKAAREYIPILQSAEKTGGNNRKWQTFKELYDDFIRLHSAKKSRSTINCYHAAIRFYEPLFKKALPAIEIDDLQDCIDACPYGVQTRRNMRTVASLIYKHAIPRHQTETSINLASFLTVGADDAGQGCGFTAEQLAAIRKGAETIPPVGIADQIYADCYLGFRITELIGLTISSYDEAHKAFHGGIKTTAGKDRTVTVSPKIAAIVDRYLQNKKEGAVFTDPQGKAWTTKKFRAAFYETLDMLGIENPKDDKGRYMLTPHSMRHTFATLLKHIPAPDKDKMELMGHASKEMVESYQDVAYSDLQRITDAL